MVYSRNRIHVFFAIKLLKYANNLLWDEIVFVFLHQLSATSFGMGPDDEAFRRKLSKFLNFGKIITKLWIMDRKVLMSMVCCHLTSIIGRRQLSICQLGGSRKPKNWRWYNALAPLSFLSARWQQILIER